MKFVGKWVELGSIMLSEINHTQINGNVCSS